MTPSPVFVRVAHAAVTQGEGILATVGVGSCVVILLYDASAHIAAMAHVLLPAPRGEAGLENPGKYASTAVPHLLWEMSEAGADESRITARLVGGASMFGSASGPVMAGAGERNLAAARSALRQAGVRVTGEEVGGGHGRSVHLHAWDGRVLVTSYRRADVIL